MESKREKFERLAEKRVSDALKKLRLIGNLANKNNYDYTDQHAKQIINSIEAEVKLLKTRFAEEAASKSSEFSFKK